VYRRRPGRHRQRCSYARHRMTFHSASSDSNIAPSSDRMYPPDGIDRVPSTSGLARLAARAQAVVVARCAVWSGGTRACARRKVARSGEMALILRRADDWRSAATAIRAGVTRRAGVRVVACCPVGS
jgi:hypothetical protein